MRRRDPKSDDNPSQKHQPIARSARSLLLRSFSIVHGRERRTERRGDALFAGEPEKPRRRLPKSGEQIHGAREQRRASRSDFDASV